MYLIKGGRSESGAHHVFVDDEPAGGVPAGCSVLYGVKLIAHPQSDDPDAPTIRVVLYRDPAKPSEYHYLLSPQKAGHLRRVGGMPFVCRTWDEFARIHPAVAAEMGG
jgi:hypothetical protein